MHGLKSAILEMFQKSADWLDWPSPFSAALQNGSQDFFFLYYYILIFIYFFKYENIVSRNGLSLGYSEQDTSSVLSFLIVHLLIILYVLKKGNKTGT